ncbi:TolC family protein [Stieleria tagensis]|uniref:TolC family protein n=1 Tax=Stieleria tagensis TaxID=2956795 RepID=UPI00209A77DE|nr:TolC family protein [Stieleria tagensis]
MALHVKSKKRAYLAAMICGSLLMMPGCGIPGLRCAQRGAEMPGSYNWNNGSEYFNASGVDESVDAANESHSTATVDLKAADQDVVATHLNDEDGDDAALAPVVGDDGVDATDAKDESRFASFIKAASFAQPSQVDNLNQDIANPSVEEPGELIEVSPEDAEPATLTDDSVDLDFGLTSMEFGITPLENSAQLSQAAFFDDPYLLGLITQALVGNQELKILAEEIQIARNETYARSGEYRPFVTLGAGAGLEKPGRHTRAGAVEDQLEVAPGKAFPDPLPDFLVASNVSWELDIWKRLRNAQSAAAMRYLGTQEGRTYIVTRLVAEVAESYYELLALDNRMLTLDKTIEIQQQSLKIANAKKEAGRGTELAVQRFQAEVRKNQSEKSIIGQEIVEVENRINFLVGRFPQPVERISVEYVDLNLNALSAGVPSQLLQNRADIRQAERNIAAAGLDVQVARARFYPSLTLSGGLGWSAFSTGYLFRTPESLIYSLAGELVGPLINKRAIKADYSSANAAQLQSIYEYQKTVLTAHIEVVNHITKIENYRRSIEIKKEQLESLEASVDSASKLFQNARAEYVEVLLAQRELMEAKMLLIDIKREQLSAIVNAYQSLGGGGF